MAGIRPQDLLDDVIRPALAAIGLGGRAAEEMLLGTAAQESDLGARLAQQDGPALGIYQTEPRTHEDLIVNFLRGRRPLMNHVLALSAPFCPLVEQLKGNLYYATAIARVIYLRAPEELPAAGDHDAQARFYKTHYNTACGAATPAEYVANYAALVGDCA